MGCKQSRQVQVQPVGLKETDKSKLRKCMSDNDPIEYDIDERSKRRDRNKRRKQKKTLGSNDSLDDGDSLGSDRGGSAGSKGSKKSDDSGLDMGEENHGFITEYSDPDKVREIESNFKEREGLELGVTGTQLPTRNSAKDKARLEESMVLQKLRDEGLISKPAAEKSGGVSFEIFEVSSTANSGQKALPALPPLKLAKLEKRRKKKKSLTEEEIKEKLQRAELRRKKKEKARLEKIKEMDKSDQTAALESFAEYQKKKEETVTQKMETVNENREKRLREAKEKAKERERRREEVRRRKQLRKEMAMQEGETEDKNNEIIGDASELMPRQETPIVPE